MNLVYILGLFCIILVPSIDCSYSYLGCFHDVESYPDLDEHQITFAADELTVDVCAFQCRESGSPYAGLHRGSVCYCGHFYGQYGRADDIFCNYTCDHHFCGGNEANSVYYVMEPETDDQREYRAYDSVATFENARSVCVASDGDLVTQRASYNNTYAAQLFSEFSLSDNAFWFGLRFQFIPTCRPSLCDVNNPACGDAECNAPDSYSCADYKWVNYDVSTDMPFNSSCTTAGIAAMWKAGESFQNQCVIMNLTTNRLETTSCFAQYAYLCYSSNEAETEVEEEDEIVVAVTDTPEDAATRTALFVVLPIFFLCYGGSCILYCMHKIYRYCRRRRRKHMRLERQSSFMEFEPETKPKPAAAMKPHTGSPQVVNVQEKPIHVEKEKAEQMKKARAEKRRNKLLENALQEARDRRYRERSTLDDYDVTPPAAAAAAAVTTTWGAQKSMGSRSSRMSFDGIGSRNESHASLLDDDRKTDSPEDPTGMAIADILRVKQLMKERKKRVRKILLS